GELGGQLLALPLAEPQPDPELWAAAGEDQGEADPASRPAHPRGQPGGPGGPAAPPRGPPRDPAGGGPRGQLGGGAGCGGAEGPGPRGAGDRRGPRPGPADGRPGVPGWGGLNSPPLPPPRPGRGSPRLSLREVAQFGAGQSLVDPDLGRGRPAAHAAVEQI